MPISRTRRTPSGLGLATEAHRTTAWRILRRLSSRPPARTCKGSIRDLTLVSRAKDEAEDSGDLALSRLAIDALRDIRWSISRSCLEKDARPVELDGFFSRPNPRLNARLNADLNRLETMKTRGYKSGKRAWIDVLPAGGPRMRVTHEVLEGTWKKAKTPAERRKRARGRRSMQNAFAHQHYMLAAEAEAELQENLAQQEEARLAGHFRKLRSLEKKYAALVEQQRIESAATLEPRRREMGLEGLGSSFALMWAAAGAVALVVLSDAQRSGVRIERAPLDPAREAIFQDLNRARRAQGLPPLSR